MIDWLAGVNLADAIGGALVSLSVDAVIAWAFYRAGASRTTARASRAMFVQLVHEMNLQLGVWLRVANEEELPALFAVIERLAKMPDDEKRTLFRRTAAEMKSGEVTPLGTPPLH